jgi:WD40 repeat protein
MLAENESWGTQGLAFAKNDRHLLAMGNRDVTVWDLAKGERVTSIGIESPSIWSEISVDAEGRRMAINGRDRIDVYDVETGYHLTTLRGHATRISSIEISADGTRLISGSRDQTAKLWQLPD